jgi:RNA polymerase sigma factor (TIGR02999 family)
MRVPNETGDAASKTAREVFRDEFQRAAQGEEKALATIVPLLFDELKRLARRRRRAAAGPVSLSTTELVHEAYLKLAGGGASWNDRLHFFSLAARVMRQVLVDRGRARRRDKRGGGALTVDLDHAGELAAFGPDVLELNLALERLGALDARKERLVELVYFAGLTQPEAAQATTLSLATVERELKFARAWLRRELGRASGSAAIAGGP